MAALGYEFYLLVLKVSPTPSLRSFVRDPLSTADKIRIPVRPCNILYFQWRIQLILITQ